MAFWLEKKDNVAMEDMNPVKKGTRILDAVESDRTSPIISEKPVK